MLLSVGATTWLAWMGRQWFPGRRAAHARGEFAVSFLVLTGSSPRSTSSFPRAASSGATCGWGCRHFSLFWIGKLLISLYMAKAAVGSSFGAAGAIVVVIAWVYYTAQVFFLGAEFTRQYALRHGSKRTSGSIAGAAPMPRPNDEDALVQARRAHRARPGPGAGERKA
jgi:membrane protein